jgi:hypothetical protein
MDAHTVQVKHSLYALCGKEISEGTYVLVSYAKMTYLVNTLQYGALCALMCCDM